MFLGDIPMADTRRLSAEKEVIEGFIGLQGRSPRTVRFALGVVPDVIEIRGALRVIGRGGSMQRRRAVETGEGFRGLATLIFAA